jgi:hypothetical protein
LDDDKSTSMIVDTPSPHPAENSVSTASINDAPSRRSAPSSNPSVSVASTKGNNKRKQTSERASGRTSKKQKKQQRKKKEKHCTNTDESDAEESNNDDNDDEEGFEEMPSDLDTNSDADEDIPLSLMTRTTARQLAKDAITDSSALVGCDQSITQGPPDRELLKILPSVGEITDPSLQSTNAPLPDQREDQSPHSMVTVQTSNAALELCQPDRPAAVNIATDSSAVDSSPIDGFDQPGSLLSPHLTASPSSQDFRSVLPRQPQLPQHPLSRRI